MRMYCILFIVFVGLVLMSCTDATVSQVTSYGDKHKIELYSGGKMVRSWVSTGKVKSESNSDGYYFRDNETDKLVRVTGDLVITPVE